MSNNPSKLICITGMDGSGKSTLVNLLSRQVKNVRVAGIWDILDQSEIALFQSKKDVDDYLCALDPDSRLFFLAHALQYSINAALKTGIPFIIFNAYFYKYFATELALGANWGLVKDLIQYFPKPDITIDLRLSPKEAAQRKKAFSRYECGMAKNPDVQSFVNFQNRALYHWNIFDKSGNWHELDASQPPETLQAQVLKWINKT